MKYLFLGTLLMTLAACGTSKTKLSSKGKDVRVLTSRKNRDCHVINKVVGENEKGLTELAKNHARNLVAKDGGNAIYYKEVVANGNKVRVHAIGYQCEE